MKKVTISTKQETLTYTLGELMTVGAERFRKPMDRATYVKKDKMFKRLMAITKPVELPQKDKKEVKA